ncbi:MAG: hypothetical protein QOE37_935, partial [Microbacteriaceae bacterium]|nr:hypothetical protein [Microbacteriaceae bacterium]
VELKRGLERERVDDDGFTIGTATDETSMRAMWSHFLDLMAPGDPA